MIASARTEAPPGSPSIMIAARDHLDEFVRQAVESVRRWTPQPYTLILIDDNSTDGTGEFFDKHGDIVIHNTQNCGLSVVRNQGLRIATELRSDPIVQMDSDAWVLEGWLDETRHGLEYTGAWIVGGSGWRIGPAPDYPLTCRQRTPAPQLALIAEPVDYVATCFWAAVGDIVERVGWFDEEWCNWAAEDMDIGMRTWIAGGSVWQWPIPACHLGGGSTVQMVDKANFIYDPNRDRSADPWQVKWHKPEWQAKWTHSMAAARFWQLAVVY